MFSNNKILVRIAQQNTDIKNILLSSDNNYYKGCRKKKIQEFLVNKNYLVDNTLVEKIVVKYPFSARSNELDGKLNKVFSQHKINCFCDT